jgi:hypothetical protein
LELNTKSPFRGSFVRSLKIVDVCKIAKYPQFKI